MKKQLKTRDSNSQQHVVGHYDFDDDEIHLTGQSRHLLNNYLYHLQEQDEHLVVRRFRERQEKH